MNNCNNQSRIIHIDFADFMWKMLMQWKAILLVCLVMAVLVAGTKYIKDSEQYNRALTEQKKVEQEQDESLSSDERIEAALETLPAEMRTDVLFVLQQQDLLKSYKEYLANSILIASDPTSQRQLSINYLITDNAHIGLQTICNAYDTYLKRDDFLDALREVISPDTELKYIGELVNPEPNEKEKIIISNDSGTIYTVRIVLPDDADSDAVIAVVDSSISTAHAELFGNSSEQQYQKISVDDEHVYNEKTSSRRYTITTNVNNISSSINNAKNSLSTDQKAVLETITAIKNAEDKGYDPSDSAVDTSESNTPERLGISKKYLLLGFVFGAFIYVGICFIIMILKKEFPSASMVQDITDTRLFGALYRVKKPHGLSWLLTSRKVAEWRYGDKLNTSKQTTSIVSTILSVCAHSNIDSITLLLSGVSNDFNDYVTAIADKCKASAGGLTAVNVLNADSMNEKALNELSYALYVVCDRSKILKVSELTALCKAYDIKALGSIYFSDI